MNVPQPTGSSYVFIIVLGLLLISGNLGVDRNPQWILHSNGHSRRLESTNSVEKHAVAVLAPRTDGDLGDLCLALKSLSQHNIVPNTTPILVFFEEGFGHKTKLIVMKCSQNPISFHIVDFSFPEGFQHQGKLDKVLTRMKGLATRLGRHEWGYVQMIRFWNTLIWKHPDVQKFDTIMRIDTDSCFVDRGGQKMDAYLPSIPDQFVYRAKGPGLGSNVYVSGLYDFTIWYMKTEGIEPSNPDLWDYVKSSWENQKTLPVVQTNFEVTRKSFFQREDVMKWHDALTEHEPFGVFRFRWGDAQTRVLTMAMFGTRESVLFKSHPGYKHGRGICAEYSKV